MIKALESDHWLKELSRILNVGPPNSGKTTSLLTADRPLHVLAMPGEHGVVSIRHDPDNGVHVYSFTDPLKDGTPMSSTQVVAEVRNFAIRLMMGKAGPVATFAGDGIHKIVDYFIDSAFDGRYLTNEEVPKDEIGKAWSAGYREFTEFIKLLNNSGIPNVIWNCWDGPEPDRQKQGPGDRVGTHTWPDLPGKLAKRITGEFAATLYSRLIPGPKPGDPPRYAWQLAPDDQVWGVAVKLPPEIRARLPKYMPQDYQKFKAIMSSAKAEADAARSAAPPPGGAPAVKE